MCKSVGRHVSERCHLSFYFICRDLVEPSMYQRLSAHISSVDLPDLSDLKETARETASRVESAFVRSEKKVTSGSRTSSLTASKTSVECSSQNAMDRATDSMSKQPPLK